MEAAAAQRPQAGDSNPATVPGRRLVSGDAKRLGDARQLAGDEPEPPPPPRSFTTDTCTRPAVDPALFLPLSFEFKSP